jgi:magnesium chelatase subunit H
MPTSSPPTPFSPPIFYRDAFQNVVELLDDLFARAAAADEPDEMNYIRKHARTLESKGVTAGTTARLFSNPAGES